MVKEKNDIGVKWMDKLDVARQFGLLNRRSQAFITAACADMGIAFSECVLLLKLYHRAGINQENMSAILFIDKAATTRTIKSLEKKGFIKRQQSDDDKRMKNRGMQLGIIVCFISLVMLSGCGKKNRNCPGSSTSKNGKNSDRESSRGVELFWRSAWSL
jgi:hypothetical protein